MMILQNDFVVAESAVTNELSRKGCPVEGYIQHISASPFSVICFNEAGVRLYHEVAKISTTFCDATGTIISFPKTRSEKKKTIHYYALVINHPVPAKPPIAVAELITSDHTVLSIAFFLQCFRRAEGIIYTSTVKPCQIIIDRSIVLLLSFLQVFNMETLHDYLNRTFRVVTGAERAIDTVKVSPHACKSHVMNSAKKECRKW